MSTYQTWAAPISDTLAHFEAWAQFFGAGFTTLGWVAQTGHGEVVASGTGASYAFTTPVLPNCAAAVASPNAYTFKGAFDTTNATNYLGGNSSSLTTECDLVTKAGSTWQCIVGNSRFTVSAVSFSGTTATYTGVFTGGGSSLWVGYSFQISGFVSNSGNNGTFTVTSNTTTQIVCTNANVSTGNESATAFAGCVPNSAAILIWTPLQFEIWKSNGANTASLPIYVRLTYTQGTAASAFRILMQIGTGVDSNGNITNPLTLSGSPTYTTQIDNSSTTSSSVGEMDFAGDADNFRFLIFRGPPSNSSINFLNLVVVDRSKNSSGADTDAFFYYGSILGNSGAQATRSAIMLNSALGSQVGVTSTGWQGVVASGGITGSLSLFGSTPIFPIFPVVGYIANPLLGAVGVHHDEVANADGSIIPVWIYGATHSYLVSSQVTAGAGFIDTNIASHGCNAAILWE